MDMPTKQQAVASNREAWNDSARHHKDNPEWQVLLDAVSRPDFSRIDDTLRGVLEQVGVEGRDLVQLGCNNGRESLSLFALGARSVVGLISPPRFLSRPGNWGPVHPMTPNSSKPIFINCRRSLRGDLMWR